MDALLQRGDAPSQLRAARDIPLVASMHTWRWAVPAAIFLLGFGLRLAYINHESVGCDEAFSLTVSRLPLNEMIHELIQDSVHPPLHYFMLRGWFKLVGFGVVQARLLSALFGTLAVVLVFFFAKYLFDRRTGLLSSFLLAISQVSIWFAQEPRPYAQLQFFAILSSYLFVRALREERGLYWWGFVGSSILMLYTHYFGAFVIAALLLSAAIYRKRYRLRHSWVLSGVAIALASCLPWIASGVIRAAANHPNIRARFLTAHWYTVFTAVNYFNNGKPAGFWTSAPWWTFVVGGLLFGLPMALAVRKLLAAKAVGGGGERLAHEGPVVVGILALLPLCIVIALALTFHMQYNVRYVLVCAAPYYVLVARGISGLRSNALRWGLVVLILVYSANSLRANYVMRWKEDVRDAFSYVESNREDGDCGVFLPGFEAGIQWRFYQADRLSFKEIPRDRLTAGLSECGRIWVVSRAAMESSWRQSELERRPVELTHSKIDERLYYCVRVALYSRK